MKFRKSARYLVFRKRYAALTTNERLLAESWRRRALMLLLKAKQRNVAASMANRYRFAARVCMANYVSIMAERPIPVDELHRYDRTIDSFTESQCWAYFATRKPDLPRLLRALQFPDECRLKNRGKMSGEEVFLRGMYELVSGEDQFSAAENVFGREQSQQSRAFTYFIDHVYDKHSHLLTDNLEWFFENGLIEESRQAFTAKLAQLGLQYEDPDEQQEIGLVIDCNCLESSRVGGGPRTDGPDAERHLTIIQEAFYNGWKSIHGLKHQTLDTAHGFTAHVYGPTSLRRNDLRLLSASNVNGKLAELCEKYGQKCRAYGDSIYPQQSHIFSCHKGEWADLSIQKRAENNIRKSVRIGIEWNYGVTSNIFGYLKQLHKLKVLGSTNCVKVFTVATLLRNCHIALYGGISSGYFNIAMPEDMLERYMRVV